MTFPRQANPHLAVDKTLCISIRERNDRREILMEETRGLGLDIEFVLTEKDSENPERGCFLAHRQCAEIALSRGYQRILILEDDARREENGCTPKTIRTTNLFLEKQNPEIFYLGYILGKVWLTKKWRILGCSVYGGHAYILSRIGCEKLSKTDYTGEPIDVFYKKTFTGNAILPPLFSQWPCSKFESDIYAERLKSGNPKVMDEAYWEKQHRKLNMKNIITWSIKRIIKNISPRQP